MENIELWFLNYRYINVPAIKELNQTDSTKNDQSEIN